MKEFILSFFEINHNDTRTSVRINKARSMPRLWLILLWWVCMFICHRYCCVYVWSLCEINIRERERESIAEREKFPKKNREGKFLSRGIFGPFGSWSKPTNTISIPLLDGWVRWGRFDFFISTTISIYNSLFPYQQQFPYLGILNHGCAIILYTFFLCRSRKVLLPPSIGAVVVEDWTWNLFLSQKPPSHVC